MQSFEPLLQKFEALAQILLEAKGDSARKRKIEKEIGKERKTLLDVLAKALATAEERIQRFEMIFRDQLFETLKEQRLGSTVHHLKNDEKLLGSLRAAGAHFVHTLARVLGGGTFKNDHQEALFIAEHMPSLKVRTIIRWQQGGPLTSRKKFFADLIPALTAQKIRKEKIEELVGAFRSYRAIAGRE